MGKLNWGKTACAVFLLCATTAIALPAQTFNTLHSFDYTDGANPLAGLVQATDGNLYGTTALGGAIGYGTVFKISPSGTLMTLYNFCLQSRCADGESPQAGLIQATNGNFYGTAEGGGANGWGTVFEITPTGKLTTLYSFCSQSGCTDGSVPVAAVVQATDGNFYGTTYQGGANNDGTVFKITPTGSLTTLYRFCSQSNCADGATPFAGLVQATDRNFYGTTASGGASGDGTVFKITASGTLTTLHSFDGTDGGAPEAALIQATDGNLYGTTASGGANAAGTIFKITPTGILTTLHNFCSQSGCADGAYPTAALVQANDGNLYGTTEFGGPNFSGTIFKVTPSGTLTALYSFCPQGNCPVGAGANAMIQDTSGLFYGTTADTGNISCPNGCGTVFSLQTGLGPVVSLSPASLTFGPQGVSAPNVPQVVTLTNTGGLPLSITGIAVTGQNSGDFAQVNNCPISPNTLAAGDSCRITVYFFPVGSGTLAAAVTITDNAPGSPQNVSLSGVGVSGKPGLAGPRR